MTTKPKYSLDRTHVAKHLRKHTGSFTRSPILPACFSLSTRHIYCVHCFHWRRLLFRSNKKAIWGWESSVGIWRVTVQGKQLVVLRWMARWRLSRLHLYGNVPLKILESQQIWASIRWRIPVPEWVLAPELSDNSRSCIWNTLVPVFFWFKRAILSFG